MHGTGGKKGSRKVVVGMRQLLAKGAYTGADHKSQEEI